MSIKKIESIEIKFEKEIIKSKKVKTSLSKEKKAHLGKVRKEMEDKIRECRKKIIDKKRYLGTKKLKIAECRKKISKELSILTPKELGNKKNNFHYQKILQENMEKATQREKLIITYTNKEYKEIKVIQAEIDNLHEKIEKIKQQHKNAWYSNYQVIKEKIKNKYPYYIEVKKNRDGTKIIESHDSYRLPERVCREDFLISPLEEYITRFKNGEDVDIIQLDGDRLLYLYGNNIYKAHRPYSNKQLLLLILDLEDKERRKFERLKHKFSLSEEEVDKRRENIPENVRIAVWRRDEGKCVRCGSRENLEYDHIIPVSKGGSNTVRNIELLCEKCNREKSDKIM